MKKLLSWLIFISFFSPIFPLDINRQALLNIASGYLDIGDWKEANTNAVTIGSGQFQSPYIQCSDKPYYYNYNTGRKNLDGSDIIERNEADNSAMDRAKKGYFHILPYAFGVADTPSDFKSRIASNSVTPGGFNRLDDSGTEDAFSASQSDFTAKVSGIECTKFVCRMYGFLLDDVHQLTNISLSVDSKNLNVGDFLWYPTKHTMLFGGFTDSTKTRCRIYEAQAGQGLEWGEDYRGIKNVSPDKINQYLLNHCRIPPATVLREGDIDFLAGQQSTINFPSKNDHYDYRRNFDNYSPYPQFVLTPPSNAKVMSDNSFFIGDNNEFNFNLTARSGSRILKASDKPADKNWDDISIKINGQQIPVGINPGADKPYAFSFSFNSAGYWQDEGGGLSCLKLSVCATNTSWLKGGSTYRDRPAVFDQEIHFSDSQTFTFYRYTGKMPAIAKAVIVVDDANGKVLAYYHFVKSSGVWAVNSEFAADGETLGTGNKRVKVYAGFSNPMKNARVSLIKSGDAGPIGVNIYDWLGLKTLKSDMQKDLQLEFCPFPSGLSFRDPNDSAEFSGENSLSWMSQYRDISVSDLTNINLLAVSGHDENGRDIDANPVTDASLDSAKADGGSLDFLNYEHSTPMYLPLTFDCGSPQLTYVNIGYQKTAGQGFINKGEWDSSQINNGKYGVIKNFADVGGGTLKISLTADDDQILDGAKTFMFLVPDDKVNLFNQAKKSYLTRYNGINPSGLSDNEVVELRNNELISFITNLLHSTSFDDFKKIKKLGYKKELSLNISSPNGIRPVLIKGQVASLSANSLNITSSYVDWGHSIKASYTENSMSAVIPAGGLPEKKYQLAIIVADQTYKRIITLNGTGGTRSMLMEQNTNTGGKIALNRNYSSSTLITRDGVSSSSTSSQETDDPTIADCDGCFTTPEFALDYTPPAFTFKLGDLFGDVMNSAAEAFKLQLTEDLSRSVHITVTSRDRNNSDMNNNILVQGKYVISGLDQLAAGNPAGVTVAPDGEGIPGMSISNTNGQFYVYWDVKALIQNRGLLAAGLNGSFEITAEDDAGNDWNNGISFDVSKIISDSVRSELLQSLGLSDKSLIVVPGFSDGGLEIDPAKYILLGLGIQGKTVPIYPADEGSQGGEAVRKVKDAIRSYFNNSGGNKIVVTSWGTSGLWVRKALLDDKSLAPMVQRIVEIGVPANGFNSISQAPQSYAIYMTLEPLLNLLSSIPFPMNGKDGTISDALKSQGLDLEGMVGKSVRNDAIINPMNLIALLLGRADAALAMDAGSDLMKSVRNFDPKSLGIEVAGVKSALWPDMPGEVQLGISLVAGIAGFAGAYHDVKLFSMDSKVFNDLDQRLGKIAADYAEDAMNRYVYDPIWNKLEGEIRGLTEKAFDLAEDGARQAVFGNANPDDVLAKYTDLKKTLNKIKKLSDGVPLATRRQLYADLQTKLKVLLNDPALENAFQQIKGSVEGPVRNVNVLLHQQGSDLMAKAGTIHKYINDANGWLNGDQLVSIVKSSLAQGEKPQWLANILPNYQEMAAQMVGDVYSQVVNYAFTTVGQQVGVPDAYKELKGYMDNADSTLDSISNTVGSIMTVADGIESMVTNSTLSNFVDSLVSTENLDNLINQPDITNKVDALCGFVNTYTGVMQCDVESVLSAVQDSLGAGGSSVRSLIGDIENLKEQPVVLVKGLYDRGKGFLNSGTRQIVQGQVASVINQLIPGDIKKAGLDVYMPDGFVGAVLMAAIAYLGSDYVKNTDLSSESSPLLLTKIFGLSGGQTGGGTLKASFDEMAKNGNTLMGLMAQPSPRIILTAMNKKSLPSYSLTSGPSGAEYLKSSRMGKDGKLQAEMDHVSEVKMKDFLNTIDGVVKDTYPGMLKLYVSINYEDFREIKLSPQGEFTVSGIRLVEGANNIKFASRSVFKDRNGNEQNAGNVGTAEYTVLLDMMPAQAFAAYPSMGQVLNFDRSRLSDCDVKIGFYNSDADASFVSTNVNLSVKRMMTPFTNDIYSNFYASWTTISNYFIKSESSSTWSINFNLDRVGGVLPEGQYAVKTESVDSSGNKSTTVTGFYNDTTAPTVTFDAMGPVKAGQDISASYNIDDNPVPIIKSRKAWVDGTPVSSGGLSAIGYDGFVTNLGGLADGTHQVIVALEDQAGNKGTYSNEFAVDTTPPALTVLTNEISNVINSEQDILKVSFIEDDPGSAVMSNEAYFRLMFADKNSNSRFYGGKLIEKENFGKLSDYLWTFQDYYQNIPDGQYTVSISAGDKTGNSTSTNTYDTVIDRTAPSVGQSFAIPFVVPLSSVKTTINYKLYEDEDYSGNRGDITVSLDVREKYSGRMIGSLTNAPSSQDGIANQVFLYGSPAEAPAEPGQLSNSIMITNTNGTPLSDGAYQVLLRAVDCHGNTASRIIEFVVGGVKPLIASPKAYDTNNALAPVAVAGNVGITGVAKDPVWDNSQEFKNYGLYIKPGVYGVPEDLSDSALLDGGWTNYGAALTVPEINHAVGDPANISRRAVEEDSLLGYLSTTNVTNGNYTLLLTASEADAGALTASLGDPALGIIKGAQYGDVSYIAVANATNSNGVIDGLSGIDPAVTNQSAAVLLPAEVSLYGASVSNNTRLDGTNKIYVNYSLSVKNVESADVGLSVYGPGGNNVYNSKVFNLNGVKLIDPTPGVVEGYNVFQRPDGWHILMKTTNSLPVRYSGRVSADGPVKLLSDNFNTSVDRGVTYQADREFQFAAYPSTNFSVSTNTFWNNTNFVTNAPSGTRELVFRVNSGRLYLELMVNDQARPELIYVNNANPSLTSRLGASLDAYTNVMNANGIDSQVPVAVTNATGFWLTNACPENPFEWDGRDIYGSLVEDGNYSFVLTADGLGGRGFDSAEISDTPLTSSFSMFTNSAVPQAFDPFGPDIKSSTLSVGFNKSAFVDVDVVKNGAVLCPLITNQSVRGGYINTLSYNGSSNFTGSADVLSNGEYSFRISARTESGQQLSANVPFSIITENGTNGLMASLAVEGGTNSNGIAAVNGDARFVWKINSLKGTYYQPIQVVYKVKLRGKQTPVGYPSVPFVTEATRWFDTVKNVGIGAKVACSFNSPGVGYEVASNIVTNMDLTVGQNHLYPNLVNTNVYYCPNANPDTYWEVLGYWFCYQYIGIHHFSFTNQFLQKLSSNYCAYNPDFSTMTNYALNMYTTNCYYNNDAVSFFDTNNGLKLDSLTFASNTGGNLDPYYHTQPIFNFRTGFALSFDPNGLWTNRMWRTPLNRFSQWASENKFYYKAKSEEEEDLDLLSAVHNPELTTNQTPIYNYETVTNLITNTVIDSEGSNTNIYYTPLVVKSGLVNRYITAAHDFGPEVLTNYYANFQAYSPNTNQNFLCFLPGEYTNLTNEHYEIRTNIGAVSGIDIPYTEYRQFETNYITNILVNQSMTDAVYSITNFVSKNISIDFRQLTNIVNMWVTVDGNKVSIQMTNYTTNYAIIYSKAYGDGSISNIYLQKAQDSNSNTVLTNIYMAIGAQYNYIRNRNLTINLNQTYGVNFTNLVQVRGGYPTILLNPNKYGASTTYYDLLYDALPFPANYSDVDTYNSSKKKTDTSGSYFEKYDFSQTNAFVHPAESFVNYGGEGSSWVTVTNVIYLSTTNPAYELNTNNLRNMFTSSNFLKTYGPNLGKRTTLQFDTLSITNSFANIHLTNLLVEVADVKLMDTNFKPDLNGTNFLEVKLDGMLASNFAVAFNRVNVTNESCTHWQEWTLTNDPSLPNAVLESGTNSIGQDEFNGKTILLTVEKTALYPKDPALTNNAGVFWVSNNNLADNPWLLLDTTSVSESNVELYYPNGERDNDLYVTNLVKASRGMLNWRFDVGIKPLKEGRKIVGVKGSVNSAYELFYFDGKDQFEITNSITNVMINSGMLGYWDITKLNGRYTLVLRAYKDGFTQYARQTVDIGTNLTFTPGTTNFDVSTPFNRVTMELPASLSNTLVNISPLDLKDIPSSEFGARMPDIAPIGPVLKVQPSPKDFGTNTAEWPVITIRYTGEEATNYGLLDSSPCIYTITENGLEPLNTLVAYMLKITNMNGTQSENWSNSTKDNYDIMQLSASTSHFSYFFVLSNTNINYPAPEISRTALSNMARVLGKDLFLTKESNFNVTGRAPLGANVPQDIQCWVGSNMDLHNGSLISTAQASGGAGTMISFEIATNADGSRYRKTNTYDAGMVSFLNVPLNDGTNVLFWKFNSIYSPVDSVTLIRDGEPAKLLVWNAMEAFSPNGDGRKDSFTADYQLNKPALIKIEVYDTNGGILFTESSNAAVSGRFEWGGTNASGVKYDDGRYDYRVYTVDAIGNKTEAQLGTVRIDTKLPSLTLAQSKAVLNASGFAGLDYTATKPVSVSAEIYDINGKLTNITKIDGTNSSGTIGMYGLDDRYMPLPNGNFSVRVLYEDVAGNQGVPAVSKLVIDRLPPIVTEPVADPSRFIPGRNNVKFTFYSTKEGAAKFVLSNTGDTMVSGLPVYCGNNSFTWDGMLNGSPVAAGKYTVYLSVVDDNGNSSALKQTNFEAVIDRAPPDVVYFNTSTNRLSDASGNLNQITVNYSVTDDISVLNPAPGKTGAPDQPFAAVYNSSDNRIAVLAPYMPAATNTVYWYGKDDSGAYVPEGFYTIKIEGRDEQGNDIINSPAASVLVDNTPPSVKEWNISGQYLSTADGAKQSVLKLAAADADVITADISIRMGGVGIRKIYSGPLTNNIEKLVVWNGTNDSGLQAIDGYYQWYAILKDQSGNSVEMKTNIILDGTPPAMVLLTNDGSPFSPNDDGLKDALSVVVKADDSVSESLLCTYLIYQVSDDSLVYSNQTVIPRGFAVTNLWDGRNSFGNEVSDGAYRIEATCEDLAGNKCAYWKHTECIVDTVAPGSPLVTVNPGLISPGGSSGWLNSTVISNSIPAGKDVRLTHLIEGDSGKYGWTAKGSGIYYPAEPGNITVSADGFATNYINTNLDLNILLSGGKASQISYPVIPASWSVNIDAYRVGVDAKKTFTQEQVLLRNGGTSLMATNFNIGTNSYYGSICSNLFQYAPQSGYVFEQSMMRTLCSASNFITGSTSGPDILTNYHFYDSQGLCNLVVLFFVRNLGYPGSFYNTYDLHAVLTGSVYSNTNYYSNIVQSCANGVNYITHTNTYGVNFKSNTFVFTPATGSSFDTNYLNFTYYTDYVNSLYGVVSNRSWIGQDGSYYITFYYSKGDFPGWTDYNINCNLSGRQIPASKTWDFYREEQSQSGGQPYNVIRTNLYQFSAQTNFNFQPGSMTYYLFTNIAFPNLTNWDFISNSNYYVGVSYTSTSGAQTATVRAFEDAYAPRNMDLKGSTNISALDGAVRVLSINGFNTNVIRSATSSNALIYQSGGTAYLRVTNEQKNSGDWTSSGGLYAEYYDNGALAMTRVDSDLNFNWGTNTPAGMMLDRAYLYRWTGMLKLDSIGNYSIRLVPSSDARIYLSNSAYVMGYGPGGVTNSAMNTEIALSNLSAGYYYPFAAEMTGNSGTKSIRLEWKKPGDTAFSTVPAAALYNTTSVAVRADGLSSTNVKIIGRLSDYVIIPADVRSNANVNISFSADTNFLVKLYQGPNLTDISAGIDNLTVSPSTSLSDWYIYGRVKDIPGYSYTIQPFTRSFTLPVNVSALKPMIVAKNDYSNEYGTIETSLPGAVTNYRLSSDNPRFSFSMTNFDFTGRLQSITVSNSGSAAFQSAEVRVDNQYLIDNEDGSGNKENIFKYFSYPAGMDPALVSITNWDVSLFGYGAGQETNCAQGFSVGTVRTSLNEGTGLTEKNGWFAVSQTNRGQSIYKRFHDGLSVPAGSIISDTWYGTNENNGSIAADGIAYSKVVVFDAASNKAMVITPIELDSTPPLVRIDSPNPFDLIKGLTNITGTIFDKHLESYVLAVSNALGLNEVLVSGTNAVSNGILAVLDTAGLDITNYIVVDALDVLSNKTHFELPFRTSETSNFIIAQVNGGVFSTNGLVKVDYIYQDISLQVSLNGQALTSWMNLNGCGTNEFIYTPAGLTNGNYRLVFLPKAGGRSLPVRNVDFEMDSTPPASVLLNITNGSVVKGLLDIHGSAYDKNFSGYRLSVSNTADASVVQIVQGTAPVTNASLGHYDSSAINAASFMDGTNIFVLMLSAADAAGNTNRTNVNIKIDNAKPLAEIQNTNNRLTACHSPAGVSIAVKDANISGANLSWIAQNNATNAIADLTGLNTNYSGNVLWDCSALDGPVNLFLRAYDSAGNTNSTNRSFIVDNRPPEIVSFVLNNGWNYISASLHIRDNDSLEHHEFGVMMAGNYVKLYQELLSTSNTNLSYQGSVSGMLEDGVYSAVYKVFDRAGNEASTNFTLYVNTQPMVIVNNPLASSTVSNSNNVTEPANDQLPPVSRLTINGTYTVSGPAVFTSTNSLFLLEASDNAAGSSVSGVNYIEFRINGGVWNRYSAPIRFNADDRYLVEYHALDRTGNIEALRTNILNINSKPLYIKKMRSMVLDATNIVYQWDVDSTNGISYEFQAFGTNSILSNNFKVLSNLVLAGAPLCVTASVQAKNIYGLTSGVLTVTNILDRTIQMLKPQTGISNYYQDGFPVIADIESPVKSIKTVQTAKLGGGVRVPMNWITNYSENEWNLSKNIRRLAASDKVPMDEGNYALKTAWVNQSGDYREDSRLVQIDRTPPQVGFWNGSNAISDGFATTSNGLIIDVKAFDPLTNGVSSGIRRIWYGIVRLTGQQAGTLNHNSRMMPVAPDLSAIEFGEYNGPLNLSSGCYLIAAKAVDNSHSGLQALNNNSFTWPDDLDGNMSAVAYAVVRVGTDVPVPPADTAPPAITVTGVSNGMYYNTNVMVSVAAADPNLAGTKWMLDNAVVNTNQSCIVSEGMHCVDVTAWDYSHNTNRAIVNFTLDKTPPQVSIKGLDTNTNYGPVRITCQVSDMNLGSVDAYLNNKWVSVSNLFVTNSGDYTLRVEARDLAGNITVALKKFRIEEADTEPPAITITGITNSRYYSSPVNLQVAVTDPHLDVRNTEVWIDNIYQEMTNGVSCTNITNEGTHSIHVYAQDLYGNITSYFRDIVIDRSAPVIGAVNFYSGHNYLCLTPAVTVSDKISNAVRVEERLQSGTNQSRLYTNDLITNPGSYTMTVSARDEAGNTTCSNWTFSIVKDLQQTLLLYAGFEKQDSAYAPFACTNQKALNITNKPCFENGWCNNGIQAHKQDSPGVVYSLSNQLLINPVKATVDFMFNKHLPDGLMKKSGKMTLFEVATNTNAVLKLYLDAQNGLMLALNGTNYTAEKDAANPASRSCDEKKDWQNIRLVYDLNPAAGQPYVMVVLDKTRKALYYLKGLLSLPLSGTGRLYFGFDPGDGWQASEWFTLDELSIYEDVDAGKN